MKTLTPGTLPTPGAAMTWYDAFIAEDISPQELRSQARDLLARFQQAQAFDKSTPLLQAMGRYDAGQDAYMLELNAWHGVDPDQRPPRDEWMGRMRPIATERDDALFALYRLVWGAR